jgi:hypothetical protein
MKCNLSLRLPEDLHQSLLAIARREVRPLSGQVEFMLRQQLAGTVVRSDTDDHHDTDERSAGRSA